VDIPLCRCTPDQLREFCKTHKLIIEPYCDVSSNYADIRLLVDEEPEYPISVYSRIEIKDSKRELLFNIGEDNFDPFIHSFHEVTRLLAHYLATNPEKDYI